MTSDTSSWLASKNWSPSLEQGLLCALVVVGIPSALFVAGIAPVERLAYPASALILGGYFYAKRSPWYIGLLIWLFCATPLVRRLVDEQAGWDPSNPVLLAPYLPCVFAGISFFQYIFRPKSPLVLAFATVIACIFYGLLVAVLNGRLQSGAVDAMKWSAGPLVAVHILANPQCRAEIHKVALASLLIAAPLMAGYGIAQYLDPQSWDADWMVNVASLGLDSIGVPRPFEMRVFGTMNSPGSLAAILSVGILVGVQRRLLVALPVLLVTCIGLLLTQYRAVWAGTLLGIMYLALMGSARTKISICITIALLMMLITSVAVVPQFQQAVVQRLQTLNQLDSDYSGEDRMHQYQNFLTGADQGQDLVVGEGLAIDGASRRLDHKNTAVIDSGLIEIYSAFGVFVGSAFLCGLLGAVAITFYPVTRHRADMLLYRASAMSLISQLPFGSVHVGELGFCTWVFVGLAAALVINEGRASGVVLERTWQQL